MKRIGVLYHPINKTAYPLAQKLHRFLIAQGVSAWLCSAWEREEARCQMDSTECIITIGGDGTILRTAQMAAPHAIPITGVNLGRLGFMTELNVAEAEEMLSRLLMGEGWLDERAMLETEFKTADKEAPAVFTALNDVVVARGEIARMVRIEARVDDETLTTYTADGVILATATGSTGYSLSAGAPILHPGALEFLMVPILPHLSFSYPLILPSGAQVKLVVNVVHPAVLSIDGHINLPVTDGASLVVRQSAYKTRFLRIHPPSFYGSLEPGLKGKH